MNVFSLPTAPEKSWLLQWSGTEQVSWSGSGVCGKERTMQPGPERQEDVHVPSGEENDASG